MDSVTKNKLEIKSDKIPPDKSTLKNGMENCDSKELEICSIGSFIGRDHTIKAKLADKEVIDAYLDNGARACIIHSK